MGPDLSFLRGHRLTVYSSSDCPDCTRLMQWMKRVGLESDVVSIDAVPEAAEKLERETGYQAVPFILIDGRTWLRGHHREERSNFNEAVLLEELRIAIGSARDLSP